MLHIWRNTPLGRENLLQSLYFCRKLGGIRLGIYRPVSRQGLMYFENAVVTIELDNSYLVYPETSEAHVREILDSGKVPWQFVEPSAFTNTLPDIPAKWAFMSCPRVISQAASLIGLTHIGPKVRAIVKHANFPVFIPSPCYQEWHRVAAFFGGSQFGLRAVRLAMRIAEHAKVPLTIYTQLGDGLTREGLSQTLREANFPMDSQSPDRQWVVFESGSLEENLYSVSGDSLVVIGACGDRSIRELLFGGRLEIVQSVLPNPLMIIGPDCRIAV